MDLDVDVALALEPHPAVAALYAFSPDVQPDQYRFAVALHPFSQDEVAAAHYSILDATSREVSGRVLYFAAGRQAPAIQKFAGA